jgi:N-acetylglucosamine-6-phosphate deacetylase
MEGPYFSYKMRGAQNPAYLKEPDYEGFKKLYDGCGGLIRIVDVAPELAGSSDFIRKASKLCTVSVAHTDANYEQAKTAFADGATHLTHLYCAMPGISFHNPGVIPAAAECPRVRAELICDGHHAHPTAVSGHIKAPPQNIFLMVVNLTGRRVFQQIDTTKQRGLAGAGSADDGGHIALFHREINVFQHLMAAKGFGKMLNL